MIAFLAGLNAGIGVFLLYSGGNQVIGTMCFMVGVFGLTRIRK